MTEIMTKEEVITEIARLEKEFREEGWNAKVVDLTRPLSEILTELPDEDHCEFVRYVKANAPAQIAIISLGAINL